MASDNAGFMGCLGPGEERNTRAPLVETSVANEWAIAKSVSGRDAPRLGSSRPDARKPWRAEQWKGRIHPGDSWRRQRLSRCRSITVFPGCDGGGSIVHLVTCRASRPSPPRRREVVTSVRGFLDGTTTRRERDGSPRRLRGPPRPARSLAAAPLRRPVRFVGKHRLQTARPPPISFAVDGTRV